VVSLKPGELMPLEASLLAVGSDLEARGITPYGFLLAKHLAEGRPGTLTAHGTLYKALARLVASGLLESSWEDPEAAEAEGRPRRRLYRITGAGAVALSRAQAKERATSRGTATSRPAGGHA
jgi:PadR family transcriptional regulator, regulatory protein PadR